MEYIRFIESRRIKDKEVAECKLLFLTKDNRGILNKGEIIWYEEEPYRIMDIDNHYEFIYRNLDNVKVYGLSHIDVYVEAVNQ